MSLRRKSSAVIAKPFCRWASKIEPSIALDPNLMSFVISPLGSKVGDLEWEFPEEWTLRGSCADRTLSFALAEPGITLRPEAEKMARQYAIALAAANDNSIRSLATLQNRVRMNNRLLRACVSVIGGERMFNSMTIEELLGACRILQSDWSHDNSDRALLRKVIEEVSQYRERGLLADGYTSVDCSARLGELSSTTVSDGLDMLRSRKDQPKKHKETSISTLPFAIEWIRVLLPIARTYIELAPHITRHLDRYEELRRQITQTAAGRAKKVVGRAVTKAYVEFAIAEMKDERWTAPDGSVLNHLPFKTDETIVFPPRHTNHLFALVASLQIVLFQLVAFSSAARASELYTVSTRGISESEGEEAIYAIQGLIFKGTGAVGYRRQKWIVSREVIEAIRIQDRLFEQVRVGNQLWCQTAQGSVGQPMRGSEQMHLTTFVRRHRLGALVDGGKICTRRFRKTWAELAMLQNVPVDLIRQQLGHAPSEGGISDQNITYMFASRDASLRLQLANPEARGVTSEIEGLMMEVFKR